MATPAAPAGVARVASGCGAMTPLTTGNRKSVAALGSWTYTCSATAGAVNRTSVTAAASPVTLVSAKLAQEARDSAPSDAENHMIETPNSTPGPDRGQETCNETVRPVGRDPRSDRTSPCLRRTEIGRCEDSVESSQSGFSIAAIERGFNHEDQRTHSIAGASRLLYDCRRARGVRDGHVDRTGPTPGRLVVTVRRFVRQPAIDAADDPSSTGTERAGTARQRGGTSIVSGAGERETIRSTPARCTAITATSITRRMPSTSGPSRAI